MKNEKILKTILISLIIVYPGFFLFQEGDFTDTGFLLTRYKYFIEDFHENRVASGLLLTNALGYLWYILFPKLGILGYKLLYYLIYLLSIRLAWLFIRMYSEITVILLGSIFAGIVYAERFWNFVFSYDIFSFILLGYATYYLNRSYISKRNFIFNFYGGLLIGLASFARIGNITFLPMVFLLFFLHLLISKKPLHLNDVKELTAKYISVSLGFFTVVIVILTWIYSNEFLEAYLNGFKQISTSKSYKLNNLINVYIYDIKQILKNSAVWIIFLFVYGYNKLGFRKGIFIFLGIVVICYTFWDYHGYGYQAKLKYLLPSFGILPLLMTILFSRRNRITSALLIIFSIAIIFGTNTGLALKINYAQLLILPFSIYSISNYFYNKANNIRRAVSFFLITFLISTLVLSLHSTIGWIYHSDKGLTCRLNFIHKISDGPFRGLYTNAEKSEKIAELQGLDTNILESTAFVLVHEPMVYYLLNRNAPITNYWLANEVTTTEQLLKDLNMLIKRKERVSIITSNGKEGFESNVWFKVVFDSFQKEKVVHKVHSSKHYEVYNFYIKKKE